MTGDGDTKGRLSAVKWFAAYQGFALAAHATEVLRPCSAIAQAVPWRPFDTGVAVHVMPGPLENLHGDRFCEDFGSCSDLR